MKYLHVYNSEKELLAGLRSRSAESFSYIYNKYSGALYYCILQAGSELEPALEILAEVFKLIFKEINGYNPNKEKLFIWMYKITIKTLNHRTIQASNT